MEEETIILALTMFVLYFIYIIVASHVTLYLVIFKGHKVDPKILVLCIFITLPTIIFMISVYYNYKRIKEKKHD